jgi:hypothetical protein
MRGSRGTSRPQRQARSGVVYKESDDDDEEFVPNARSSSDVVGRRTSLRIGVAEVEDFGIAKGKRTLTLKRARALVRAALLLFFCSITIDLHFPPTPSLAMCAQSCKSMKLSSVLC